MASALDGGGAVQIDKQVDTTSFGVTVVKLELRGAADVPLAVEVLDALPAAVDPADVALPAALGGEEWRAEGGLLRLETTVEPGGVLTRSYVVAGEPPVDDLAGEPVVTTERLTGDADDGVAPGSDEASPPATDGGTSGAVSAAVADLLGAIRPRPTHRRGTSHRRRRRSHRARPRRPRRSR